MKALAKLQQLTSREPSLAPAQDLLSIVYFRKNRYRVAVAALEKACDAAPANIAYLQKLSGAYN